MPENWAAYAEKEGHQCNRGIIVFNCEADALSNVNRYLINKSTGRAKDVYIEDKSTLTVGYEGGVKISYYKKSQ